MYVLFICSFIYNLSLVSYPCCATTHALYGNFFFVIWTALCILPRSINAGGKFTLEATQTNTVQSEYDMKRSNSEQETKLKEQLLLSHGRGLSMKSLTRTRKLYL